MSDPLCHGIGLIVLAWVVDTSRALGDDVADCSTLCFWPTDRRDQDPIGKVGILYVKWVYADGRLRFLSSANLTEYAFSIKIDLGGLITGGEHPMIVGGSSGG